MDDFKTDGFFKKTTKIIGANLGESEKLLLASIDAELTRGEEDEKTTY